MVSVCGYHSNRSGARYLSSPLKGPIFGLNWPRRTRCWFRALLVAPRSAYPVSTRLPVPELSNESQFSAANSNGDAIRAISTALFAHRSSLFSGSLFVRQKEEIVFTSVNTSYCDFQTKFRSVNLIPLRLCFLFLFPGLS